MGSNNNVASADSAGLPPSWAAANSCVGTFVAWMGASCGFWLLVFVTQPIKSAFSLTETQVAAIGSVTLAARVIGAAVFGLVAELHGRKVPFLVSIALTGSSAGLVAIAPT